MERAWGKCSSLAIQAYQRQRNARSILKGFQSQQVKYNRAENKIMEGERRNIYTLPGSMPRLREVTMSSSYDMADSHRTPIKI